jgi:hypothetical protein
MNQSEHMAAIRKAFDRFIETDIDEEVIIMRQDNGELLSLTETAATIWRLIDGSRDRAALVGALAKTFASDKSVIEADVDEFLLRLRETGFLADG